MRKSFHFYLLLIGLLLTLDIATHAGPRRFFNKRHCPPPVCVQPAPVTQSLPFVILARSGGEESRFGTLAEAVHAAKDKDIIEIRGNGPYYASNIIIKGKELTIRGGEGFDPVIRPHPEHTKLGRTVLFITDSPIHIRNFTLDGVGLRF